MERRRFGRFALAGLLCSTLGLLTAFGVAVWAANPNLPAFETGLRPARDWQGRQGSMGIRGVLADGFARSQCSLISHLQRGDRHSITFVEGALQTSGLPRWSTELAPFRELAQGSQLTLTAYGWPKRCFVAGIAHSGTPHGSGWAGPSHGAYRAERGLIAIVGSLNGFGNSFVVPSIPIWSGLVVDSAVFGAGWALILATGVGMIVRLRDRRRRSRGMCADCGYDLCGDFAGGCPECGWNRAGDRSARTSP